MVARDNHHGFQPGGPPGRRFTPGSRTRKGHATPPLDPAIADTLVEGVKVVFDDWTDDHDRKRSVARSAAPETLRLEVPPPAVAETVKPGLRPRKQRGWTRIVATVLGLGIMVGLFVVFGGGASLIVGAAAVAAAMMLLVPSGIDVVVVPPSAAPVEIVAPAASPEEKSDADLVIMPDPGFKGGVPIEKEIRR